MASALAQRGARRIDGAIIADPRRLGSDIAASDDDAEETASPGTSADADKRASRGEDPPSPGEAGSGSTSSAEADREASMGNDAAATT